MKRLLMASLLFSTVVAQAETLRLQSDKGTSSVSVNKVATLAGEIHEIRFDLAKIEAEALAGRPQFKVLSEKGINFSQDVGLASVPFKSVVVAGDPETTEVTIEVGNAVEVGVLSAPSQEEDCRCATDAVKKWSFTPNKDREMVRKDYLGTYRGLPLTRVTIYAAEADYANKSMRFYPNLRAQITSTEKISELYNRETKSSYDYLIVTPSALVSGLDAFVVYKTVRGHNVKVVELENIGSDVKKLTEFFKSEYKANQYKK